MTKTPSQRSSRVRPAGAGRMLRRVLSPRRHLKPFHLRAMPAAAVVALLALYGCVPEVHQPTARSAAFPVMNEKIFIYPVVDSSSLEDFEGWPPEKPLQDILKSQLRNLDGALLAHFRQREKFGLYEMVEDSLPSTVRVTFTIGRFESRQNELAFPVRMTARRLGDNVERSFSMSASGRYRAKSKPKSPLHYLDILIADFRRNFPYETFSGVFYRSFKNGERHR